MYIGDTYATLGVFLFRHLIEHNCRSTNVGLTANSTIAHV